MPASSNSNSNNSSNPYSGTNNSTSFNDTAGTYFNGSNHSSNSAVGAAAAHTFVQPFIIRYTRAL